MYVIAKPCAPPKLPRVLMLLSLTLFLPLSFRFFFSLSPHSIDLPLLDRNPLLFVPLGALVSACDCYFCYPVCLDCASWSAAILVVFGVLVAVVLSFFLGFSFVTCFFICFLVS